MKTLLTTILLAFTSITTRCRPHSVIKRTRFTTDVDSTAARHTIKDRSKKKMLPCFHQIQLYLLICVASISAAFNPANAEGYRDSAQPLAHIFELQGGLKELGYDPGATDGIMGSKTSEAIRAFQRDHELTEDGKYSTYVLLDVQRQVAIAREEATPEGRKRKEEKENLLAMSDDELVRLIQNSQQKEARRVLDLIGERALDLPASVIFAAIFSENGSDENAKKITVLFSDIIPRLGLAMLLYQFTDVKDGIRQFQQDLGEKVTGELTLRQIGELGKRKARLYETPVNLPTFTKINIYSDDGYVSTEGTWVLEGEQIAWPIQTTKITCRRDTRECVEITARLTVPGVDEDGDSYMLHVDSRSWSVLSWDSNQIIARDPGRCRTAVLTVGLQSQEVYEITSNNEGKECSESPLRGLSLEKPRMARLVAGYELSTNFWEVRRKSHLDYISSSFLEELKEEGLDLFKVMGIEVPSVQNGSR